MEQTWNGYWITDAANKVDINAVCDLLSGSYWAAERPREIIERSLQGSICISVFHEEQQIGFLRAVTDHATITWICDVIVHPEYRGRGIGNIEKQITLLGDLLLDGC